MCLWCISFPYYAVTFLSASHPPIRIIFGTSMHIIKPVPLYLHPPSQSQWSRLVPSPFRHPLLKKRPSMQLSPFRHPLLKKRPSMQMLPTPLCGISHNHRSRTMTHGQEQVKASSNASSQDAARPARATCNSCGTFATTSLVTTSLSNTSKVRSFMSNTVQPTHQQGLAVKRKSRRRRRHHRIRKNLKPKPNLKSRNPKQPQKNIKQKRKIRQVRKIRKLRKIRKIRKIKGISRRQGMCQDMHVEAKMIIPMRNDDASFRHRGACRYHPDSSGWPDSFGPRRH